MMTIPTNRLYVKPVFWFIAGMVILFCLFRTVSAIESGRWFYFFCFNGLGYCAVSFYYFRVILPISISYLTSSYSSFFGMSITYLAFSVFICLSVSFLYQLLTSYTFFASIAFFQSFRVAQLALVMKSIFATFAFVKIREGFGLFTHTAFFGLVRHY